MWLSAFEKPGYIFTLTQRRDAGYALILFDMCDILSLPFSRVPVSSHICFFVVDYAQEETMTEMISEVAKELVDMSLS